jgi:hypothetical protein
MNEVKRVYYMLRWFTRDGEGQEYRPVDGGPCSREEAARYATKEEARAASPNFFSRTGNHLRVVKVTVRAKSK